MVHFGLGAAALLLAALAGPACPATGAVQAHGWQQWRAALQGQLAEGDLLFREGTGPEAAAVRAMEDETRLSHVGMVFRRAQGWEVLHADPEAGVIAEPLDRFLAGDRATGYALYRHAGMAGSRAAIRAAAEDKVATRTPFDDDFDLTDHRKLYCTEYVWTILSGAGLHPAAVQTHVRLPLAPIDVMLPTDLIRAARLVPILHS